MPSVSRLGDGIIGVTSGEHSGHSSPHSPSTLTGNIAGACSSNVLTNNYPTATIGSVTEEHDSCCGTAYGSISGGSSRVYVNGIPIARSGDSVSPHNGTANISGGSPNVFAN